MEKNDLFPAIVWLALGIAVMTISYKLKLGSLENPGPGLMPFLWGTILFICSLPILIRSFPMIPSHGRQEGPGMWAGVELRKIILTLASLAGYIALLEKIGFTITTFALLVLMYRFVGSQKWRWVFVSSALTMLIAHFLFVTCLKVELPSGLWR